MSDISVKVTTNVIVNENSRPATPPNPQPKENTPCNVKVDDSCIIVNNNNGVIPSDHTPVSFEKEVYHPVVIENVPLELISHTKTYTIVNDNSSKNEDSPVSFVKKLTTGVLIGGSAGAVANSLGRGFVTSVLTKPSLFGVGLGTSLGTGFALANTKVDNENLKVAKNTAAGAMIGGGASGVAVSIAKSTIANNIQRASSAGVTFGAAIGAGIALANVEVKDPGLKVAKNIAAGAMIGGGVTGLAEPFGKSLVTNLIEKASLKGVVLGTALGTGIVLANTNVESSGLRLAKNAAAGAMIAGSSAGILSAVIKTISTQTMSQPSLLAMGLATAVGAGIAVASTKTE